MRMLVLGAGLQGSACAYDLLQNPAVTQVRLADLRFDHLPTFLAPMSGPRLSGCSTTFTSCRSTFAKCARVSRAGTIGSCPSSRAVL